MQRHACRYKKKQKALALLPVAAIHPNRQMLLQVAAFDSFAARSLSLLPTRLCRGLPARSVHPPSSRLRRARPEPPETIVINRAEGSARRDGQRRVTGEASDFNRPTN